MCTLILAFRVFDDSPVFLASNRDERLDRAAVGPLLWPGDPAFVAPRDEVAGGTWLGLNERGVLVAVTNRFGAGRDATRRSRGALVVEALGHETAEQAARAAADAPALRHNPFHLVLADNKSAHVVVNDGDDVTWQRLEPGIHVTTERSFDAAPNGRRIRLLEKIDVLRDADTLSRENLTQLLAEHRKDDFDVPSVRVEELGYGTRSSTTIDVGRRKLLYSAGSPHDTTPYEDFSALLGAL